MNEIASDIDFSDDLIAIDDVSDEALENAAGTSATPQAASSLWSSFSVEGCTCVR